MIRPSLDDLAAFAQVARARSFTRAAAELGLSPSALSQKLRQLEETLGLRLLTRTTRAVSPTAAGERLLATLAPRLAEIAAELAQLTALRDRPAGRVRLTASAVAAEQVIWPRLMPALRAYPDIELDLSIDDGFRDIAAEGFDAGVRLGDAVEKDMVAVRIGPDGRLIAVASPDYLAAHPAPQSPRDLVGHRCINLRLVASGALYAWEFARAGESLRVKVQGQVTFNAVAPCLWAAREGFGLAFLPEALVGADLALGRLVQVLDDWTQPFAGFHLYYPSRRQTSPALRVVIEALAVKAL
ncbi:LysR family transcriptional regulator [Rhodobacter sp. KR11]|uniref:LysR family transcriptional regulator n=1 Tax=Rhodobacter sp. KR11 TaxID=2974588 RepID=UPI002223C029|nr:LysR family transcriptional regulator [Rhodobacter sp. KR11]MCW1917933.1 LysR family transcriptional regulator [Rhodobacter sp. KR11]